MAQLNVKLSEAPMSALRQYAARRRTPVSWLIKDYIDYLLAGGEPPTIIATDSSSAHELTLWAQYGGAFEWLKDEPDIYTLEDGEPV